MITGVALPDGAGAQPHAFLIRYVEVVNRALAVTRHLFPLRVVLDALRNQLVGRCVRVVLLDAAGRPALAADYDFDGVRFEVSTRHDRLVAARWTVRHRHVRDVVYQPWRYLADPLLIELPPFSLCAGPTPRSCRPAPDRHVEDRIACSEVES